MRKIIASEYVSLDAMMDEPGLWSMPFFNDEISQYKHDELFSADALILGRVTYDGFSVAWPTFTDEFGFADRMNGLPKHVASRPRTDLDWNATVIRGDLIDEVAKLKQQSGQSLLIGDSGQIASWCTPSCWETAPRYSERSPRPPSPSPTRRPSAPALSLSPISQQNATRPSLRVRWYRRWRKLAAGDSRPWTQTAMARPA